MDTHEKLLEKKKIDILKAINSNLAGIYTKLDSINENFKRMTGGNMLPGSGDEIKTKD